MRILAHLSHLKVGRCPKELLKKLEATLDRLQPSVVAISGNLTAAGTEYQLQQAREFLDGLPGPRVLVPGDTDVPLWDPVARLLTPWELFEEVFGKNRTPYFADNEIVVAGLRTARPFPFQKVKIQPAEILFVQELMGTAEAGLVKIIVSHRPLFLPDKLDPSEEDGRVFRSQVDLFVTGQLWSHREAEGRRESDTTLFVGSRPTDPPGFQILRIDSADVVIENYLWDASTKDFSMQTSNQKMLTILNRRTA